MPALIRTDGFGKVHRACFLNLAENRVGSARMSQVFIEENLVPEYTAVILNEHGRWRITDKAGFGFVINKTLAWDITLNDGDVFEIGQSKFRFDKYLTYESANRPATYISGTAQLPDAASKKARHGRLTEQWKGGKAYNLGFGSISIGKVGCDINIDDKFVSNSHCTVFYKDGRWFIRDNKSTNGTTAGSLTLRDGAEAELSDDATITLGQPSLSFELLDEDELKPGPAAFKGLIGESPAMKGLIKVIEKVAKAEGYVLITGEPGTGKELVANALHELSPCGEAGGPFHPVNCASLTPELAGSK